LAQTLGWISSTAMNDDPNWEMAGFCPPGKDPGFGEFQGQVNKILPSGCAFITCQEVKDLYDQDAYVHSTVVEQCALQMGEEICFNVHVSSAGRPQVSAPCWKRRQQSLKRSVLQVAGVTGSLAGANGGKSIAKGQTGLQRPGTGEVVKARRLVETLNPGQSGKGKGNGSAMHVPQTPQLPQQDVGVASLPTGDLMMGTIKIVNPAKDFSLISCPETGLTQDVYVHGSVATPQGFVQGDIVVFSYGMGQRGPQANAVFKLVGFLPQGREPQLPLYQGIISRILPNGNGFVVCEEVAAAYGRDAFIHSSVVQQCGLNVEDRIAFDVHVSKDGNPQASAPCWQQIAPSDQVAAMQQAMQPVQVGQAFAGRAFPSPVPLAGKGGGPMGPKLTTTKGGTVRIDVTKGGFQSPPSNLSKGAPKGVPKPQPKLVLSKGAQNPMVAAQAQARVTLAQQAFATKLDDLEIDWMPDDFHVGRVCQVDVIRNVSMVRCPASHLSRDVYVHQSVAEPSALMVNDVACFKLHLNRHGLPQASAPLWKRVGTDVNDSAVRFGEFQGLVMRSEDSSACVECPEVTQLHGKDAFMPEETLSLCGLVEGNLICFDVLVNENGDPEAMPPCWICCSSERWVKDIVNTGDPSLAEQPADVV